MLTAHAREQRLRRRQLVRPLQRLKRQRERAPWLARVGQSLLRVLGRTAQGTGGMQDVGDLDAGGVRHKEDDLANLYVAAA